MLSTFLEMFGAAVVVAAAFTVDVTFGLVMAGVTLVAAGFRLERTGR